MRNRRVNSVVIRALFLLAIFITACQQAPFPEMAPVTVTPPVIAPPTTPDPPTPAVVVAATPRPATAVPTATAPATVTTTTEPLFKELTVCLAGEPDSLYLYAGPGLTDPALHHLLYENLFTNLSFDYQAQGLEKLPSLADGDATLRQVNVRTGDLVVDSLGHVVRLQQGTLLRNAAGEVITFDGEAAVVGQMVVQFTLQPMVWSDGTPVTAEDSVFSFNVAAHPDTPGSKQRLERSASYTAVDERTVVWTGLPGWHDPLYFTNVWTPLPSHQLQAYSSQQLRIAPETARHPLSSGPFIIAEWEPGSHLRFARNPHYYRAAAGLPHLDSVTLRFEPDAHRVKTELLAGGCDIATGDSLNMADLPELLAEAERGLWQVHTQPGPIFEHIALGIDPAEEYAATRRDWFGEARVRQAMVMCTDRQRMVDELLYGRSAVMDAYVPASHPLFPDDATSWPYDVDRANALLDEAGFQRDAEDGIRRWPRRDEPFQVTLGTSADATLRARINAIFQENMADCGIVVETYVEPVGQWFAPGPAGTLFGRRFDLGTFAWLAGAVPPCHLYSSDAIPGPSDNHPAGWSGQNVTGWSDPDFDTACQAARATFPGTEEYRQSHQEALRIFAQQLPIIPLFPYLKLAATRPEVLNFHLDPTQPSELWNVFEWDVTME